MALLGNKHRQYQSIPDGRETQTDDLLEFQPLDYQHHKQQHDG
jgi:hypothetical protein